jgi:hypothetical protein
LAAFKKKTEETNFQLTDSSIELFSKDGQVIKLNYSDINSILIIEERKFSMKNYAIAYWTIWTAFVLGLLTYIVGLDFFLDIFKEYKIWGLIFTLGLLAFRPIYSMLPSGTIMEIVTSSKTNRVSIDDIIKDDQIHGLINHLKQKVDLEKIKIKK